MGIFADGIEKLVAYRATTEAARLDRHQSFREPRERVPGAHYGPRPLKTDFVSDADPCEREAFPWARKAGQDEVHLVREVK